MKKAHFKKTMNQKPLFIVLYIVSLLFPKIGHNFREEIFICPNRNNNYFGFTLINLQALKLSQQCK